MIIFYVRKIINGYPLAIAQDHGPFEYIIQLADVAPPGKGHQQPDGSVVSPLVSFFHIYVVAPDEIFDQRRNVFAPLPQRRNTNIDNIKAVIEILPKLSLVAGDF